MATTAKLFGKFFLSQANKEVDLDTDDLKVMLLTDAVAPDQDTWQYKSDIAAASAVESAGTGYTAGGQSLGSVTLVYDAASNTVVLDADDTAWPNSTVAARYAVIYDATPGSDATRPLIGWVDFGQTVSSTAATFQIAWNASNGVVRLTAA